jgi:hypothetical protein
MSNIKNALGGWKQTPATTFALGDVDDSSLPSYPRLPTSNNNTSKKSKEAPLKFKCPMTDCKEVLRTEEELEKHQWQKCHWRCVPCAIDYPDEDALYVHNSKVRNYLI